MHGILQLLTEADHGPGLSVLLPAMNSIDKRELYPWGSHCMPMPASFYVRSGAPWETPAARFRRESSTCYLSLHPPPTCSESLQDRRS